MSNEKSEESKRHMKGNKDSGAIMDVNGDVQNYDTQHNSGGSGIVVMKGGKPELYGQSKNVVRGVPTKEELEKSEQENDPIKTMTRVTILPDMLESDEDEKIISTELPEKREAKQVTRIDVDKTSTIAASPEIKRKRGRPRKS